MTDKKKTKKKMCEIKSNFCSGSLIATYQGSARGLPLWRSR